MILECHLRLRLTPVSPSEAFPYLRCPLQLIDGHTRLYGLAAYLADSEEVGQSVALGEGTGLQRCA